MLPPGPRTPAIWQTYRYVVTPASFMREMHAAFGDAVSFHSVMGKGIAVFEASLARDVFAAPPETFEPVPLVEALFGGSAVIAVSGDRHRRLRKLLNPPFHGEKVRGFLGAMQRAVRGSLGVFERAARTGSPVLMTDVSQAMALDVILETVFGAGDLDRVAGRATLLDTIGAFSPAIVGGQLLHKAWFPPWRRFVRARRRFDRWVGELVAQRRTRGAEGLGDDVLGILLAARYDDGTSMGDAEIRDQLFTLLLAGHETSAIAMAWCIYHLLRNQGALATLRAEVDGIGPDLAPEALTKLRYLDAVVSETLRIEPVVTDVLRTCREPLTLGGKWTIPPGGLAAVMLASILRDPRVYPEPERFRPERFLEQRYGASEFVPFGGGARRCLGAAFAQSELAIAVGEIVSRWEIELASGSPERSIRRNLTMGPKHGVPIRVLGPRARREAGGMRVAS